ncbi:hypothetical protein F5890DRAFT_1589594 [Lentinula detonsa]|uniref:Uncharacterized protein n=1 Tax=Lentinula detonsa TaxID=2804962 RepID=A0AA38UMA0_9AGAR|nr:hypothetical protein F5890DRAFT_1589594 [Lentinula detonsa]
MEIQAQIPPALVALHNFILEHDRIDIEKYLQEDIIDNLPGFRQDEEVDFGCLTTSEWVTPQERHHAEGTRDKIAEDMWEDYRQVLRERAEHTMNIDGMDILPVD